MIRPRIAVEGQPTPIRIAGCGSPRQVAISEGQLEFVAAFVCTTSPFSSIQLETETAAVLVSSLDGRGDKATTDFPASKRIQSKRRP
jgi:hypothetical protein